VSAWNVKPIEIGGIRISASGKSVDLPSKDSGGSLAMRVGSTTLQITNSAGKIPSLPFRMWHFSEMAYFYYLLVITTKIIEY